MTIKTLLTIGAIIIALALGGLWFVFIRQIYGPISPEWRNLVALGLGILGGWAIGGIFAKAIILIWL